VILFFDTETTGLPDFKARSSDPAQPHLVQLALVTVSDDGAETQAASLIVRPDGWTIPPAMTAIHGISHERAMDEGVPETAAVTAFMMAQGAALLRVAHNESFDRRIMRIAMTRAGIQRDMIEFIEGRESFCTCNAAKPILNLPPSGKMKAVGFNGPKPPKLAECIQFFFGEDLAGAHDALVDTRACARIYFRIRNGATNAPV
jgi:DNA polymerase-3 subunit epsilon